MSHPAIVQSPIASAEFKPSPIDPSWIIDGAPVARASSLSRSADGSAWTDLWECTAGSFYWHYDINETVHIVEGGAVVTDCHGKVWHLKPSDVIQFRVGTRAHWHVPSYIRKVAFCSVTVPAPVTKVLKAKNRLRNLTGRILKRAPASATAVEQVGRYSAN